MSIDKTVLEDYSDQSNVSDYASRSELQGGEVAILERHKDTIVGARVLDIGVGGGRTTLHFAPLAKSYVGVDFAPAMVAACEKRFSGKWSHASFAECDVRDMSQFSDGSFDVVLFSYNGIDYVDHDGRLLALQEISRVLASRGLFVFSTHNSKAIPGLFTPKLEWKGGLRASLSNAKAELQDMLSLRQRYSANARRALVGQDYTQFFDGNRNTYYIHPEEQLRQLHPNFSNTEMFSYLDGRQLRESDLPTLKEDWVYFATCKSDC